ncbi:tripartite-type tricarboxylate transporter receptor subunit TctC [Bradyrhizobium sp. R2.2-H]|jgi:tripartite-type tricarboxylate transporter receptor subunit TctC|uniref:tripartite tricarboxylate transporter substrate-binding protein n=1 Tax=unclassified Bradyrhizobium TaxID=2631580 RepID=UPI0010466115|nr:MULTISPECIES: tripartite tricarboxylate transporter substrate-binding protein [unclassified Bradyrhizobium]TCU72552.1 tripartite-type tricarboxylate transporter receptor subunit TctC [Bradyrhizobium sp. Y-H1]TCU74673.1 tripartite-type tricarboxylate transporter receptor subunit TctC [Bradyrhizobium sp. R2.2-H]
MRTRRDFLRVSAASAAFSVAGPVSQIMAEPRVKTAHILTGFTAGLPDAVARLLADEMKPYATSIVVEPRPGASGRVAVEAVKAAPPDGSVILFAPTGFLTLFPHTHKTLRYEPRDFVPVSTVASFAAALTIGPRVPGEVRTLADFVLWCRANAKDATYGTPGIGTSLHLTGAALGRAAGFEFLHVPYQGRAAIQDLLKGEIASAIMPIDSSLGLVQSGKLRAVATTGSTRSPFLPDVPTLLEAGYPLLKDVTWFGFFVPAKTPPDVVEDLNGAIQAALRTSRMESSLAKLSVEIDAIAMDKFAQLLASESARWRGIVQATEYSPQD